LKKQELERKEKRLLGLKEERNNKREEIEKLEREIRDRDIGNSMCYEAYVERVLEDVSEDDKILVEERGADVVFYADLYLVKDGETIYLERRPKRKSVYRRSLASMDDTPIHLSGLLLFIEDEFEPSDVHEHFGLLEHRVWEFTGKELFILKEMMKSPELCKSYMIDGWEGIKDNINESREICDKDYPALAVYSSLSEERDIYDQSVLREMIMDRAEENDITLKEATDELKKEDEIFNRDYEKAKKPIRERVEELERVFEPYFSAKGI